MTDGRLLRIGGAGGPLPNTKNLTLVGRKIVFLRSTSVLRFIVGLHTFYCTELGDLEIISWR